MKLIRKSLILIIFLLVSVATMVTGVFAWFSGGYAKVEDFGGSVISQNEVLEVNSDMDAIFLGDRVRDLVYLNDSDFDETGFDFYGYASLVRLEVTNPGVNTATVKVNINVMASPEFGVLSGTLSGLKYVALPDHATLTQSAYLAERMLNFQNGSDVFQKMTQNNQTGFTIPPGETHFVNVYIWGYYDGLTEAQKAVFHALVYRVKVMI